MPCEDCDINFEPIEVEKDEEDFEVDESAAQSCNSNSGCIIVFAEKGSKVVINAKDVEAEEANE